MTVKEYVEKLQLEFVSNENCYSSKLNEYTTGNIVTIPYNIQFNYTKVPKTSEVFALNYAATYDTKVLPIENIQQIIARLNIGYYELSKSEISEQTKNLIDAFVADFKKNIQVNLNKKFIGIGISANRPGRSDILIELENTAAVELRLYSCGVNIED